MECFCKELTYRIPEHVCAFCGEKIVPGENLYTVVIKWGNGQSACKKCYDKYIPTEEC
jgi:hypothetical protein